MENETKVCNGPLCKGKSQPIENFGVVKGKINGICRACKNEHCRIYRLKNKDKLAKKGKIYRQNNKDKTREQGRKYRKKNKDKINGRRRKHRQKNTQGEDSYIKELISNLQLKDKKKKRSSNIDFDYIKELQKKQNNKCMYSGVDLIWKKKSGIYQGTIDRIDSSKGHIKGNVQLVTIPVNRFKSDLSHTNFLKLIDTMKNKKCDGPQKINELTTKQKTKLSYMIKSMRLKQGKLKIAEYKQTMKKSGFTNDEINFYVNFYKPDTSLDFDIKYLQELCKNNSVCTISGIKLSWDARDLFVGSGDRINSSKPYSKKNIQITSVYINYFKGTLSNDKIRILLNQIIDHYGKTYEKKDSK